MKILDTNVISELMKGDKCSENVYNWTSQQPMNNLFTTTITQAEILYGITILPLGKRQTKLLILANLMFQEDFHNRILSFNQESAIAFAQIASKRKKRGQPISHADAQIASICYTHKAILVTRNVNDFQNCGINIINLWLS